MAGKIFKAGIRFNDPDFKYMSLIFNEDNRSCTVYAHVKLNNNLIILGGYIEDWLTVESENLNSNLQSSVPAPAANTVRTTAKKAVKGSK